MNLNRPDQWRNPIYAAGEPDVTLVAIPRYQKPGVWCVRAAVRSEILLFFCDRRIANRPATRPRTIFFSKFPIVITQRPNVSFSLPFKLIYRLEHISEQDATIRLTPANSAGWSCFKCIAVYKPARVLEAVFSLQKSARISRVCVCVCNVNEGIEKFLLFTIITSPPYTARFQPSDYSSDEFERQFARR